MGTSETRGRSDSMFGLTTSALITSPSPENRAIRHKETNLTRV